ncbi:hypothetical protein GCM10010124_34760 [Pilimelia terevasa]|uniref:Uncharacterized protein n=1 Tax=Pilimelia terevasa TaxID=53372 RepID=A0A8J3BUI5_9ACTN|nr:hypothetical protein [Pilimelia terevasa]GGK39020.1 hypothetical protein GCM10010124_34760 [Pilimelia terevasa]
MRPSTRTRLAAAAGTAALSAGLVPALAPAAASATPAVVNHKPTVHIAGGLCGNRRTVVRLRLWDDHTPREQLHYTISYNGNPALFEDTPWWTAGIEHRITFNHPANPQGVADLVITVSDGQGGVTDYLLTYRIGYVAMTGTGVSDFIVGTGAASTLRGMGGTDVICGNAGDDVVDGGDGADFLYGGDGADTVDGGGGADQLTGGAQADRFVHGTGDALVDYTPTDGDTSELVG